MYSNSVQYKKLLWWKDKVLSLDFALYKSLRPINEVDKHKLQVSINKQILKICIHVMSKATDLFVSVQIKKNLY